MYSLVPTFIAITNKFRALEKLEDTSFLHISQTLRRVQFARRMKSLLFVYFNVNKLISLYSVFAGFNDYCNNFELPFLG